VDLEQALRTKEVEIKRHRDERAVSEDRNAELASALQRSVGGTVNLSLPRTLVALASILLLLLQGQVALR
jgi:hypothetical protein